MSPFSRFNFSKSSLRRKKKSRRDSRSAASRASFSTGKRLSMETLEYKIPLASDFAVTVVDGDLFIENINQEGGFGQEIAIVGTPTAGEFVLASTEDILFTNSLGDVEVIAPGDELPVSGVTGDVNANLGDFLPPVLMPEAAVSLSIFGANLLGDLSVTGSNVTNGDVDGGHRLIITENLITNEPTTIAGDVTFEVAREAVTQLDGFGVIIVQNDTVITGDLNVDFSSSTSTDTVILQDLTVGKELNIDIGRGNSPLLDVATQVDVGPITIESVSVGEDFNLTSSRGGREYELDSLSVGGDLRISLGEADDENELEINDSTVTGNLVIRTDFELSVDAGVDIITILGTSVGRNLGIKTMGGDDEVFIGDSPIETAVEVGGDLRIRTGDGDDEVEIVNVDIGDDLRVSAGQGDDEVEADLSTVTDNTLFTLGGGDDELSIDTLDAGYTFTVLGRGTNDIDVSGLEADYYVNVITANGDDLVRLEEVDTFSALIFTGAGDDEVTLSDSDYEILVVSLGSGDDTLIIDGEVAVSRWAVLSDGRGTDTLDTTEGTLDANILIDFVFEILEEELV